MVKGHREREVRLRPDLILVHMTCTRGILKYTFAHDDDLDPLIYALQQLRYKMLLLQYMVKMAPLLFLRLDPNSLLLVGYLYSWLTAHTD